MRSLLILTAVVAALVACLELRQGQTASAMTASLPLEDAPSPPSIAECIAPACGPDDLQITRLRVGLVCPQGRSDGGSICFETTRIPVTGQGTCVYNGERRPCTWYGFEFEYTNARPGDEISCVYTSDHTSNLGNPARVLQQNTDRYEYRLRLASQTGRHYNPQYSTFGSRRGEHVLNHTVCSLGARELFRFQLELQFPDE